MIQGLAITLVSGVVAITSLISITVLLINGVTIPDQFWAILGTSSGAAVLGGAVSQGASLASHQTPNIDRLYRDRMRRE
jgi:hypothetical protein